MIVTIDSQNAKTRGRIDPCSYDEGKKIKGKKRRSLVDAGGLLMHCLVHTADWQDPYCCVTVISTLLYRFSLLFNLYADSGYRDDRLATGSGAR